MRAVPVLLLVAMFLFVSHLNGTLQAYLDPGTGSLIIQAVLASVVGALSLGRIYWTRLKALVGRREVKEDSLAD
jgi:hypothetical protein